MDKKSSQDGDDLLGAILGERYRIVSAISRGGMGVVYRAQHIVLDKPVAVKVMLQTQDEGAHQRFLQEAKLASLVHHPNIVEIFDYGHTDDGTFYYVMEYVPGLSLDELVRRYGSLPPERVVYLLCQICDALREAHAVGLIHRDLVPPSTIAA